MKYVTLILLFISTISFADVKDQAIAGQAADAATTIIGIGQGLTETNPLGAPAAILLKPIAFGVISQLPEEEQVVGHSALSAAGWEQLVITYVFLSVVELDVYLPELLLVL
jgi:hypothetical protein